jgi:superfamily II DNA or RNA helicase
VEEDKQTEGEGNELRETRAENERLKAENSRLKALLESFTLRPASSLTTPAAKRKDQKTSQPRRQSNTSIPDSSPQAPCAPKELSPLEAEDSSSSRKVKIALLRSLFRGREDVYAVRWESRKGKSGYSPACANEWDPLLCRKPCAKCNNNKYIPISDEVIRDHVLGKHTVGIYPLLLDETCWFLAADFDKDGWQEDARAFLDVCRGLDVVATLERSRSGRGGHVWVFFEEAISAALARKLGSAILTRAMDKRHLMGLDSYDRFFPNQDTMPKGGFGNLIALPLQGVPWKKGNSLFLDEDFVPYPNQWQFLASLKKTPRSQVEQIVADASRRGQVIGVRLSGTDENEVEDPWTLPPSRRRAEKPLQGPLPKTVRAVLGNLLYIEKDGLSPQLMNRLIRLAAFQNPEFYSAQMMRLSTFGKPRVIGCAEEFPKHIALPRGCLDDLECFLASHDITLTLQDERYGGTPSVFKFHGTLQAEQENAVREVLRFDNGVLVAPTGFGKTVIAARVIAERSTNIIVLVHRKSLLDQWRERLALFLGMPIKEIGTLSGEKKKPSGLVDVALIQSLCRKGEINDIIASYGHLVVDECHHIPAFTFEQVVRQAKARYVLGLTATPIRKDGHHPIIIMQCGPIRVRIRLQDIGDQQRFRHLVIVRNTEFALPSEADEQSIQTVYAALASDTERNGVILADIREALAQGRSPLVLTERKGHLENLALELRKDVPHVIVMQGGMGKKQRTAVDEQMKSVPQDEQRVIVATGRYAGEGFDDARLDTLFLAMPISWRGTLQQYVGRLHRAHAGKHEVRVYDYVDRNVPPLARMFSKRLKGYRAMGYVAESEQGFPPENIGTRADNVSANFGDSETLFP